MSALAEALVAAQRRALQCSFGATGEDPERDEHERRSDNATDGDA